MESPLCRALQAGEALEPGDLIHVYGPEYLFAEKPGEGPDAGEAWRQALEPSRVIPLKDPKQRGYSGYQKLFHSVTWVAPGLVYGKDSPNRDDRFTFHPLSEVYARPHGSANP
jgi:hypothetical protein